MVASPFVTPPCGSSGSSYLLKSFILRSDAEHRVTKDATLTEVFQQPAKAHSEKCEAVFGKNARPR